jgi:hypothetical protein
MHAHLAALGIAAGRRSPVFSRGRKPYRGKPDPKGNAIKIIFFLHISTHLIDEKNTLFGCLKYLKKINAKVMIFRPIFAVFIRTFIRIFAANY